MGVWHREQDGGRLVRLARLGRARGAARNGTPRGPLVGDCPPACRSRDFDSRRRSADHSREGGAVPHLVRPRICLAFRDPARRGRHRRAEDLRMATRHQGGYVRVTLRDTSGRSDYVALAAVAVMGVSAAYEAAVALKWIPLGTVPGEGARFEGVFLAAGGLAMLAGVVTSLFLGVANRRWTPGVLF